MAMMLLSDGRGGMQITHSILTSNCYSIVKHCCTGWCCLRPEPPPLPCVSLLLPSLSLVIAATTGYLIKETLNQWTYLRYNHTMAVKLKTIDFGHSSPLSLPTLSFVCNLPNEMVILTTITWALLNARMEYTGALDGILKYEWEMDGDTKREVLVRREREKDCTALGPVSSSSPSAVHVPYRNR